MKKLVFISIGMLLLVKYTCGQEQPTVRQRADKLFERYEYFKSLGLYLKLAGKNNDNVQLAERIAECYRNINQYEEAEQWYAGALAYAGANRTDHYYYAEILLRNHKFDIAKKQYAIYFTNDTGALRVKLAACDSATAWMKEKSGYTVKNEPQLNTPYSDWGLSFAGNEALIFTSDRKIGEKDLDNRTGNSWFKLYQWDGKIATDMPVVIKDAAMAKSNYHVGPMVLNPSADTAYITITTGIATKKLAVEKSEINSGQRLYTRRLQLVMAAKKNGQWVVLGNFAYNDIQNYSAGNAAISKDGKVIYFTSDMPGGEGKTDIWYCKKQADGTWGRPINCGKNINTKEEEDFATTGPNGELYYSSKGLAGMGGFDIYMSKTNNGQLGSPVNLKYPVNTTSDDFYLTTGGGTTGYFSSNREGGNGGDDIYSFTYKPLDTIPAKRNTPVIAEPDLSLRTIYYDLDKSNIRPDAAVIMDQLVLLLKEHPELKIELSSYTDSRASGPYNLALSQRRVQAAVDYLVKNGIDKNRLAPKFFGKNNLVNKCADNVNCSEAEQQLNRRTEFKIIGRP